MHSFAYLSDSTVQQIRWYHSRGQIALSKKLKISLYFIPYKDILPDLLHLARKFIPFSLQSSTIHLPLFFESRREMRHIETFLR